MNIGIDIDDTIAKTTETVDLWAKEYTESILKRSFKIDNEKNILDPMWARHVYNWSKEEDSKFWDLYYEKIMESLEPKENAINVINYLARKNKIIIVTARWDRKNGIIEKITKEWLQKYKINYSKLYINHKDKRDISRENNIEIFIDDNFVTCKQLSEINIKVLMVNTRLNKNIQDVEIQRIDSWQDIYEYFLKKA